MSKFAIFIMAALVVVTGVGVPVAASFARPAIADRQADAPGLAQFPSLQARSVGKVRPPSVPQLSVIDLSADSIAPVDEVVSSDAGFVDVQVTGSAGLASARFSGSALITPTAIAADIAQDPTPDTVYDLGAGTTFGLLSVPPGANGEVAHYRLVVDVSSATAPDLDLYLGFDFNLDQQPTDFEQLCGSFSETAVEHCEIDIQNASGVVENYWWLVQNFSAGSSIDSADISVALVPLASSDGGLRATGPGHVGPGVDFSLRVGWDDPSFSLGEVRVGFVTVESAPGEVLAQVPVRLERGFGERTPRALVSGVDQPLRTDIFEIVDRVFFDVPPNAREVVFSAAGAAGIDLYAAPAPAQLPGENRTSIESAPFFTDAPFRVEGSDPEKSITVAGTDLTPGRWYLIAVTHDSNVETQDIVLRAEVTQADPRPILRSGHYFDARRIGSSSGLFLDFAGDQWFAVWYAYLEDGTPTWYFGQGPAPAADAVSFRGDLLRVSWDGDSASYVKVGEMHITPTGPEAFDFSFILDGQTGAEPMTRLGAGGCLNVAGSDLDVSGHWFTSAKSGFGYSVQVDAGSSQEIFAAYLYDAQGFPRWLFGQQPFAPDTDISLRQFDQGACPTCDFVATAPFDAQPVVGALARTYATNAITQIGVNAGLAPPLVGLWEDALPVELLSERKLCQ